MNASKDISWPVATFKLFSYFLLKSLYRHSMYYFNIIFSIWTSETKKLWAIFVSPMKYMYVQQTFVGFWASSQCHHVDIFSVCIQLSRFSSPISLWRIIWHSYVKVGSTVCASMRRVFASDIASNCRANPLPSCCVNTGGAKNEKMLKS